MATLYRSTRADNAELFSASQAILKGASPDGGLFLPEKLPALDLNLNELKDLSYQELALKILSPFFSDYTKEELTECIAKAYASFSDPLVTPVKKHGDLNYLELFYGPTIAFKDVALQLLPKLLQVAATKNKADLKSLILTATSGDTGKAAMAGFEDVKDTEIIVFYPKDGVSEIQERQMRTQTGKNTHVVGITGNFDDAQTNVKKIFDDPKMRQKIATYGYQFSSANSINIGRLFPQMVYYFFAYGQLVKQNQITVGQEINFSVPTGNFGDILAGWYAKKLGLPIKKLLCASNENNVLTDFFETGIYDKRREFHITTSPSMDILVSSNLERLLFYVLNKDGKKTADLMKQLQENGHYSLESDQVLELKKDFFAANASDQTVAKEINDVFSKTGYLLDPHTAVASNVARQYQAKTGDKTPLVVVSTASPYKFPKAVLEALKQPVPASGMDALTKLHALCKLPYPQTIKDLFSAPIIHDLTCDPEEMKELVLKIIEQN